MSLSTLSLGKIINTTSPSNCCYSSYFAAVVANITCCSFPAVPLTCAALAEHYYHIIYESWPCGMQLKHEYQLSSASALLPWPQALTHLRMSASLQEPKSIGWQLLFAKFWRPCLEHRFSRYTPQKLGFWDGEPDETRFVCINVRLLLICRSSSSPPGIPRIWWTVCHCCRQSANLFTGTQDAELYPAREDGEIILLAQRHYFHKAH